MFRLHKISFASLFFDLFGEKYQSLWNGPFLSASISYKEEITAQATIHEQVYSKPDQASPAGFTYQIRWQEERCEGFLRRAPSNLKSGKEVLYIEKLRVMLKAPWGHALCLEGKNAAPHSSFCVFSKNPFFLYLEEETKAPPGPDLSQRAQMFVSFPPLWRKEDSQSLSLRIAQAPRRKLPLMSRQREGMYIKALEMIWDFGLQSIGMEQKIPLLPFHIFGNIQDAARPSHTSFSRGLSILRKRSSPASFLEKAAAQMELHTGFANSQVLRYSVPYRGLLWHFGERDLSFLKAKRKEFAYKQIKEHIYLQGLMQETSFQKLRSYFDCVLISLARSPAALRDMGDWLDWKEPHSLGQALLQISKGIRSCKLQAALCIAPFLAAKTSRVFREYPELFLKKSHSRHYEAILWNGEEMYIFDLKKPEYLHWLYRCIHTISHKWHFSFLLLEAVELPFAMGLFPISTYKQVLGIIRKAATKKTNIALREDKKQQALGIANHLLPASPEERREKKASFGLRLERILSQMVLENCLHKRFYIYTLDPILEELHNYLGESSKKFRQRKLRLLYTIMALSSRSFFLPFTLTFTSFTEEEFSKMLHLHSLCFRWKPEALFEGSQGLSVMGWYQKAGFLGIWNTSSQVRKLECDLFGQIEGLSMSSLNRAKDYWTEEYLPWYLSEEKLQIALGPYESFIADLR